VFLVDEVIKNMSDVYPELTQRRHHILETTRAEEERFLATIDGGMARFDQLAPAGGSTQGSTHLRGTISGEDAFRLYDTYGFPIDLTELMARERGYAVDIAGFESALAQQRSQSQAERKSRKLGVGADDFADLTAWRSSGATDASSAALPPTNFVGYDTVEIDTQVAAVRRLDDDRVAVLLRETPFYAESGGQVSDHGEIIGDGWRVDVTDVRKVDGRTAAIGRATRSAERSRAFPVIVVAIPSAITPRRTCSTRRCARLRVRECIRQAPWSSPIACASTSRTTVRCVPSSCRRSSGA
jgi:alanyl-tRNA synthetase